MEWIERRAGLIGVGAVVVAAVALGVAVADHGSHSDHRMFRLAAPGFVQPYGGQPFKGGPMLRRYGGGPELQAPGGGPMLPGFAGAPGRGLRGFAGGPSVGGAPGFGGPMGIGALHGELTLPTATGQYATFDVQRGKVTKISRSSITVRSEDGFTKTYAAPAALTKGVKVGDEVVLRASVAKGTSTVTTLMSLNRTAR